MVHPRRKQNPNVKLHRMKRKNNEDYTRLVAPPTYINGQNHRNKEPTSITTGIYP